MARTDVETRDTPRIVQEVEAVCCLALGLGLLLSFVSYVPGSPGINRVGPTGFAAANLFIQCFGYAAYIFPSLLLLSALTLFTNRRATLAPVPVIGGFFLIILTSVVLGTYRAHVAPEAAGGWVGGFLATLLVSAFGGGGAAVVLSALGMLIFMMLTGRAVSELFTQFSEFFTNSLSDGRETAEKWKATLAERMESLRGLSGRFKRRRAEAARPVATRGPKGDGPAVVYGPDDFETLPPPNDELVVAAPKAKKGKKALKVVEPVELKPQVMQMAPKEPEQEEFRFDPGDENFRLPPVELLGDRDDRGAYIDEETLVASSKILEQKLATFGVNGRVVAVRPGPVITTYEFEPEPGVKVSRVVNLNDDLTMAMRAHGVRIVAPIPGKNVVGIEVSNRSRALVGLRDLIGAEEFGSHKALLPLALGRNTTGATVFGDLAKMPHLLMAGATGTGKSVALNAYIISLLYKWGPRDLRLIMIDPKMLELSLYEGIPHLLVPVVTDVKKAAAALSNAVREMERRFEMMKDKKVRSLDDYNRKVAAEIEARANNPEPEPEPEYEEGELDAEEQLREAKAALKSVGMKPAIEHEHLPRVVIIVDELADLMMSVGRDVEASITRLAQKARAAGIHMILATQRPSVDVITGLIKANFPSRISFQVTSRIDSRTILDTGGAERLLGNGDMLWMAPGTSFLQRLHGGFVSDQATEDIVEFLKGQGDPDYKMDLLATPTDDGDGFEDQEEVFDELYDRAVELVTKHGQGSTSWVQRKLGIGYNRAARMMECMEREGVVGPADGARPRQVLARALDADE